MSAYKGSSTDEWSGTLYLLEQTHDPWPMRWVQNWLTSINQLCVRVVSPTFSSCGDRQNYNYGFFSLLKLIILIITHKCNVNSRNTLNECVCVAIILRVNSQTWLANLLIIGSFLEPDEVETFYMLLKKFQLELI